MQHFCLFIPLLITNEDIQLVTQLEEGPWHHPALVLLGEDRGWGKTHPENPITANI